MALPAAAAIFDLDGTLVDNMPVHARAWVDFAAAHGVALDPARILGEWAGWKNAEILPLLFGRPLARAEVAALSDDKERRYRALVASSLAPLPGLLALLDRLDAAGIPCAVASAAPVENRDLVLGRLDLRRRMRAVIGAEDVARGKPFPDLFLAAARAVGVDPRACVAFEDALSGVRAAVAAEMRCVGVLTTMPADALRAAGAAWTIRDYEASPPDLERALFGAAPRPHAGRAPRQG